MTDDFAIQRVSSIAALRGIPVSTTRSIRLLSYYGDNNGGGGDFYGATGAAPGTYVDDGGSTIVPTGGDGSAAWVLAGGEYISILQYGAKGDGVTDDTVAIRNAIAAHNGIYIPSGNYKVTGHIAIPGGRRILGDGYDSLLFRDSDDVSTETITDSDDTVYTGRNTLLFIESGGFGTKIEDIRLAGNDNATTGTTLIEFGNNVRNVSFHAVRGAYGKVGMLSSGEVWLSKFDHVWMAACENGINFNNSGFKTTLSFEHCYLENCGTGFEFTNMQYSMLYACGADHISRPLENPYDAADVSGYAKAYGDYTRSTGVYNFSNCKGITVNSCGTEHSWGNGAFRNAASDININSPRIYYLQSAYTPNYGSYPNFGVGPFMTATEDCSFNISNVSIDTYFHRTATSTLVYFCGFNFLQSTYGFKNHIMVELHSTRAGTWANGIFGGQGNVNQYCRDYGSGINEAMECSAAALALSDVDTAQSIFASDRDALTIEPGLWLFELEISITRAAGTTSHTTALLFGGTAVISSIDYTARVSQSAGAVLGSVYGLRVAVATATVVTAANTDANENLTISARGVIRVGTGGTIIPQFKYSAAPGGAPTVARGALFSVRRWSASGDASVFGNWA